MEAIAVFLGLVVMGFFIWFLARFGAFLEDSGWPFLASFPLLIVIILVFTYFFGIVMLIADPNYLLTSMPFWPSSWLRGY